MDFNKHKFLLSQILLDIFKDITLNSVKSNSRHC